jgi:hypothetical protein
MELKFSAFAGQLIKTTWNAPDKGLMQERSVQVLWGCGTGPCTMSYVRGAKKCRITLHVRTAANISCHQCIASISA